MPCDGRWPSNSTAGGGLMTSASPPPTRPSRAGGSAPATPSCWPTSATPGSRWPVSTRPPGAAAGGQGLPAITRRQDFDSHRFHPDNLERWLLAAAPGPAVILVASVYEGAAARLEAAVAEISATRHRPIRQRRIGHADLPLEVRLPEPHRVGIDRLAGAAAAGLVKAAGRPAILVDCGTATTVDLVSAEGAFLGGAILPGPLLMARALAEGTSRLPAVAALRAAICHAMPGRSTEEAIAAGVGLGMRGLSPGWSRRAARPWPPSRSRSSPAAGPVPCGMPFPRPPRSPIWS